jgi:RNA polymerase sigma factor (sigma-70 family)
VAEGTDETDIRRIARDPAALEFFYRRYVGDITSFVSRRVSDPHLAADLTAEVFLAVIRSAHTYRPGRGTHLAWLYGIARNVIAAERKRSAYQLRVASRIAGRRLLDEDAVTRLEERIDAERRARGLCLALDEMPDGERAVLELVAVDGLDVGQAAAALRIRPGTARVRLHRARRRALKVLGEQAAPGADQVRLESTAALADAILESTCPRRTQSPSTVRLRSRLETKV